ncbi:MAG: hypothetical protein M3015_16980 [Bacteroidota bacterium]|nr:hypothetical protein [Bacteroidota bacterium]
MNILRLAGELFLIYILYKLIFEFIIPVYQSTKKIKKQFGDIQSKMQEDMNAYAKQQSSAQPKTEKTKEGDYIDFEEVKK